MTRRTILILAAFAGLASPRAHAQGFSGSQQVPASAFNNGTFRAMTPADSVTIYQPSNSGSIYGIRLSDFASAQDLAAANATIGRTRVLLVQGVALAGAFNIAPPNPGDRFAVSFGTAGFQGEAAGSVGLSYRLTPSVTLFGGYAQSAGPALVKGGLSISLP